MHRRARPPLAIALALALGAALGPTLLERPGAACDRASSSLEDPAVGVASADVVAAVSPTAFVGDVAIVRLVEVLKGDGKGTSKGDELRIQGIQPAGGPSWSRCGVATMEVGKSYLVKLWSPAAGAPGHDLVDAVGGISRDGTAERAAVRQAIAKAWPHSRWKPGPLGVHTQLLLAEEGSGSKGEVDLVVVFRNAGKAPIEFKYDSWPEATQSRCALQIVHEPSKNRLAPLDVPIPKKDIADYFSKHGRHYQVKLRPGEAHLFRLPRVTTAASGWGYKEELGFKYYPVPSHGPHALAADCTNFFAAGVRLATESLTMNL